MSLSKEALEAIVREVVQETLQGAPSAMEAALKADANDRCDTRSGTRSGAHCTPPQRTQRINDVAEVRRVVAASPSRLAQGRVGTRYTTKAYLQLRAEHAIALDAVHSELDEAFAVAHGLMPLRTLASDHNEYLLYPDKGRRLDDASKTRLQGIPQGADVAIIVGDGLSALAVEQQLPLLLPALTSSLQAERFTVAPPVFVKFARIGVQDEIGVITKARSTVILVGERPGLGTGDSLSIYTAYNPRLNQDNAEKNCISNVRALGFPPAEAAIECARLLRRTFDAGGGGVHLVRPTRDIARRVAL